MATPKPAPGDPIPELVESLLVELGEDPGRQGLKATPDRVARALRELTNGYGVRPEEVIADAIFDQDYDEMVVVKDINFYSLCEHHMLPFFGHVHVGYLHKGRVVDLSKLTFSSSIPLAAGIGIELTAYAPTLAALLVVAASREPRGIRRLLRPVLRWRAGVHWYVLAAAGSTVIFLVADAVRAVVHAPLPGHWLTFPGIGAVAFLVGALLAGAFGEEVGWRGFGQHRLQTHHGALAAALVVGVVWGLWHLWPTVAPGGLGDTTWGDGVLTLIRLTALAVLFAWLYNGTSGR